MSVLKSSVPKSFAVAVVALLLGCLVIQKAVVGAAAGTSPALALSVDPWDPEALIASTAYGDRAPRPPSATQSAALDLAARGDPLYYEPYLAKATIAASQGDHLRAQRLAEIARARDPRAKAVHLFLLQEYARAGNLHAAVAEMNPIVALSGQSGPAIADALDVLAQDRQGARIIAIALDANPSWRSAFVRQARGASEKLAFQTLVNPPRGTGDAQHDDRISFLFRLVDGKDYERAYLAWINFFPSSQIGQVAAIYDGDFAGLPGLPPFNWTLTNNETAAAERRSDSNLPGRTALDVNFFGGDAAVIATEMLFVQPGSYVFGMIGSADAAGTMAGSLRWQLTCLPSQAAIPIVTVGQFTGQPFKVLRPLSIPVSGCTAQRLSLLGDPGDVSTPIHAQFTGLRLTANR